MAESALSVHAGDKEVERFAGSIHQYMTSQIAVADQKAVLVIALAFGILAYFENQGALDVSNFLSSGLWWRATLSLVTSTALGCAIFFAWAAALPRMKTNDRTDHLIFWEVVGELSPQEYVARIRDSRVDLGEAVLRHAGELASICRRKFWFIRVAIIAAIAGGAAGFLILVVY